MIWLSTLKASFQRTKNIDGDKDSLWPRADYASTCPKATWGIDWCLFRSFILFLHLSPLLSSVEHLRRLLPSPCKCVYSIRLPASFNYSFGFWRSNPFTRLIGLVDVRIQTLTQDRAGEAAIALASLPLLRRLEFIGQVQAKNGYHYSLYQFKPTPCWFLCYSHFSTLMTLLRKRPQTVSL